MHGFLNLNKPPGLTSHDCVAKVRRSLKLKRVGHAGTLDPAATGVLPIAVGKATRLLQFLQENKAYQATIRLGVVTETDDLAGETLSAKPVPGLELETVKAALQQFQGTIQQVPPNYSAVQVKGKRLYELARKGEEIVAQPRSVEVFSITVLGWRSGEFPEVDVAITCGPGTYIRAIARDLGKVLQTGGTLANLIRTASSGFNLPDSLTLEDLDNYIQTKSFQLTPPDKALMHLPMVSLLPPIALRWCQGQKIGLSDVSLSAAGQEIAKEAEDTTSSAKSALRIYHENDTFLGVGRIVSSEGGMVLAPQVVLEDIRP